MDLNDGTFLVCPTCGDVEQSFKDWKQTLNGDSSFTCPNKVCQDTITMEQMVEHNEAAYE